MAWLVVALVVAVYALYVRWELRRKRSLASRLPESVDDPRQKRTQN